MMSPTLTAQAEKVIDKIKRNPEGLLLVAAGCALLLRTGSSRYWNAGSGDVKRSADSTFADASNQVGDYVRKAGDTAAEYATEVGSYAAATAESLKEGADRVQASLTDTVGNAVERQPLLVAAAGLLAGAAVAAAFPASDLERRAVGPLGENLKDAASDIANRLTEGAEAASDRLKQVADERGLSASGVKEVASELSQAFTEKASAEKPKQSNADSFGASRLTPGKSFS